MRAAALARGLAATLLGGAITLCTAELLVRWARPQPRAQVVDLARPGTAWVQRDGVLLWYFPGLDAPGPFRGVPCPAGAPVVALAGDSLFETIDVGHERERVADRLRVLLREAGQGEVCVVDGSWGGYVPGQQLVMLKWLAAEHDVDVAILDVWKSDRALHRFGDRLYDSEVFERDAAGAPVPPLPVPAAVHHRLLPRSRLWEYATLALAPPAPTFRDPIGAYLEASAWTAAEGVDLVLVEGAPLDRPLPVAAAERAAAAPDAPWEVLRRTAVDRGQVYLRLTDALKDADVEAIRFDTCCHYVAAGHDLVARAILPHVVAALQARRASTADAGTR